MATSRGNDDIGPDHRSKGRRGTPKGDAAGGGSRDLSELFGDADEKTRPLERTVEPDDRLAALFGERGVDAAAPEPSDGGVDGGDALAAVFAAPAIAPWQAGAVAPARTPAAGADAAPDPIVRTAPPAEPARDPNGPVIVPRARRGLAAWSGRQWSIALSVVLVAAIAVAAVVVGQMISRSNQLAEALAGLENTEARIFAPTDDLATALAAHDALVAAARPVADASAGSLAAVEGMSEDALREAALAALGVLQAELGRELPDAPEPYERAAVDEGDLDSIGAAADAASRQIVLVEAAAADADAASTALQSAIDALTVARTALGGSLPTTAAAIVEENSLPKQTLRDAVTAAAQAVVDAQAAGAAGDGELIAYATAVTALREDEARIAQAYPWLVPSTGTTTPGTGTSTTTEQPSTTTPVTTQPQDTTQPDPVATPEPTATVAPDPGA